MTFPLPGLLWISIAVLITGALLMFSTMRLRKTEQDGMFILDDATDKYQKVRVFLANTIIDLGLILSYITIILYIYPNVFYVLCNTAAYIYLIVLVLRVNTITKQTPRLLTRCLPSGLQAREAVR
jgi:hypothetical protein